MIEKNISLNNQCRTCSIGHSPGQIVLNCSCWTSEPCRAELLRTWSEKHSAPWCVSFCALGIRFSLKSLFTLAANWSRSLSAAHVCYLTCPLDTRGEEVSLSLSMSLSYSLCGRRPSVPTCPSWTLPVSMDRTHQTILIRVQTFGSSETKRNSFFYLRCLLIARLRPLTSGL